MKYTPSVRSALRPLTPVALLAIVLSLSFAPLSTPAGVLDDLNESQSAFNDAFIANGAGSFATSWTSAGGVGNSAYIGTTSSDNTALVKESVAGFAAHDDTLSCSVYFLARPPANSIKVGWDVSSTGALNYGQYIAATIMDAGSGQSKLGLTARNTFTIALQDVDAFTLVDYNWYQIEAEFTRDITPSQDQLTVVMTLRDWGSDGITDNGVVDTYTVTVSGLSSVWAATDIYAGFSGKSIGGWGGARGFDNFYATSDLDPAKDATSIRFPDSVIYDVTDFGATPNDFIDDTAAIQAAIDANKPAYDLANKVHRSKIVYIPDGVYRISDTLTFPANAVRLRLQGQSEAGTVIQLAPTDGSYDDSLSPKAMVYTSDYYHSTGASRFLMAVRNLSLDAGNHSGAIGINLYCNNVGGVRDVTITGQGYAGIDLSHSDGNGPAFINDVTIDGFEYGIRTVGPWQSNVFEDITLRNQTVCGFYNDKHVSSIRNLYADQLTVPVVQNIEGHVVIVDSDFQGASATGAAVVNDSNGKMLVHNTMINGYLTSINDPENPLASGSVPGDWTSDPMIESAGTGMPNWTVPNTPEVPWDDPADWANIADYGATDSDGLTNHPQGYYFDGDEDEMQLAMDSGKSTVLIPNGHYRAGDLATGVNAPPVYVPETVNRVYFTGVYGVPTLISTEADPSIGFIIDEPAIGSPAPGEPIIFEDMNVGYPDPTKALCIIHRANRPLILRSSAVPSLIVEDGAGPVYIESATGKRFEFDGAEVWAHQFNPESDSAITASKITMSNSQLWTLGVKTEGAGTVIESLDNSHAAVFGGLVYTLSDASAEPMLVYDDSSKLDVSLNEMLRDFGNTVRFEELIVEVDSQDVAQAILPSGDSLQADPYWPAPHSADTYLGDPNADVGSTIVLFSSPLLRPGQLSATSSAQDMTYHNLTTGGYTDWCVFGWRDHLKQVRKNGANIIADYQVIGTTVETTKRYSESSDNPWDNFTWSDGDNPVAKSNKTACVNVSGAIGEGFSIDVPADQQVRRVTIWTSGWESEATFKASLSDGSAPDYEITVLPNNPIGNFHMHRHVIEYSASVDGEVLTLSIVKNLDLNGQNGNVKLNAIAVEDL